MQGLGQINSYDIRYIHPASTLQAKAESIRDSGSEMSIVAHDTNFNGTAPDTKFGQGDVELMKSSGKLAVSYMSVGSMSDGSDYLAQFLAIPGASVVGSNLTARYLNFWARDGAGDLIILPVLKAWIAESVNAGYDGAFLDDTLRYYDYASLIGGGDVNSGLYQGTVAVMEIIQELNTHAQSIWQSLGKDGEFKLVLGSDPYLISNHRYAASVTGQAAREDLIAATQSEVDAILVESGNWLAPGGSEDGIVENLFGSFKAQNGFGDASVLSANYIANTSNTYADGGVASFTAMKTMVAAAKVGFIAYSAPFFASSQQFQKTHILLNETTAFADAFLLSDTFRNANGGAGSDYMVGHDGANVISGDAGNDEILGEGGNDTLRGGDGNDKLLGGEGNDRLDGGLGTDQMTGGGGNDFYYVNSTADVVTEEALAGTDTIVTTASLSVALAGNVENLILAGVALSAVGNTLDNRFIGNASANTLRLGAGNDVAFGNDGNDTLYGDAGSDSLSGGAGNDLFYGGTENDTLDGGLGIDRLNGDDGDDLLIGGAGNDTMSGGAGNDVYRVDSSGDVVTEGAAVGRDRVEASISYTLGNYVDDLTLSGALAINGTGNTLANTLTGNGAGNVLSGGGGNDTVQGEGGDDVLFGGLAFDILTGGSGNDTFAFDGLSSTSIDQITDFGGTDLVQVDASFFLGLVAGGSVFLFSGPGQTASGVGPQFLHNTTTGSLSFDRDGVGGVAAVTFAVLQPGAVITSADFVVVA